ncbi:hypothetical protein GIB67_029419, partial [Kingdonia uniflora]
ANNFLCNICSSILVIILTVGVLIVCTTIGSTLHLAIILKLHISSNTSLLYLSSHLRFWASC